MKKNLSKKRLEPVSNISSFEHIFEEKKHEHLEAENGRKLIFLSPLQFPIKELRFYCTLTSSFPHHSGGKLERLSQIS